MLGEVHEVGPAPPVVAGSAASISITASPPGGHHPSGARSPTSRRHEDELVVGAELEVLRCVDVHVAMRVDRVELERMGTGRPAWKR